MEGSFRIEKFVIFIKNGSFYIFSDIYVAKFSEEVQPQYNIVEGRTVLGQIIKDSETIE
jgi:hypothetical protein